MTYLAFPIIKNRYFNTAQDTIQNTKQSNSSAQVPDVTDTNAAQFDQQNTGIQSQQSSNTTQDSSHDTSPNPGTHGNSLTTIKPYQCDDKCVSFADDKKFLKYCQEVCGLSPIPIEKNAQCDIQNDLEKDYCLKNLGVNKKDLTVCEKIQDSGIKKTCKNRITEDLLGN